MVDSKEFLKTLPPIPEPPKYWHVEKISYCERIARNTIRHVPPTYRSMDFVDTNEGWKVEFRHLEDSAPVQNPFHLHRYFHFLREKINPVFRERYNHEFRSVREFYESIMDELDSYSLFRKDKNSFGERRIEFGDVLVNVFTKWGLLKGKVNA
jgi:hypothetical protein